MNCEPGHGTESARLNLRVTNIDIIDRRVSHVSLNQDEAKTGSQDEAKIRSEYVVRPKDLPCILSWMIGFRDVSTSYRIYLSCLG